jgi:hypothetical protein
LFFTYRIYRKLVSPVFLSKTDCGKVVRGLSGIPSDRPVLLVGYHFLMGLELPLLVSEFLKENRVIRGASHPILLSAFMEGFDLPEPGLSDDIVIFGGLPARKRSFVKALASGESVLLYPGGIREAFHRKVCEKSIALFFLNGWRQEDGNMDSLSSTSAISYGKAM